MALTDFPHAVTIGWDKWASLIYFLAGAGYMVRPEVYQWLLDHVGDQDHDSHYLTECHGRAGSWTITHQHGVSHPPVQIHFTNSYSAILFKLTWL